MNKRKSKSTVRLILIWLCLVACLAMGRDAIAGWQKPFKQLALGPGSLDLGLSLRLRYESLDGFTAKAYKPAGGDHVLLSRLRLNARYTLNSGPSAFAQLQDSRFWFSDLADDPAPKNPYQNYLDLRQAYVEWQKISNTPLGFKLGRQTVAYGDYHIFGPADWGNVGRYTWDLVKGSWQSGGLSFDAFWGQQVLYQKEEFDDQHLDFHVFTLYGQWAYLPKQKLDFFYVRKYNTDGGFKGESGLGDLDVNTMGVYAAGKWKQLSYKATLAWQFGDHGQDRIEAWGLAANAGYTWTLKFRPCLHLGFSQGSGDSDPKDGVYGTFDGVFGAVDKYYGRMNLFSWSNLQDFELGLSLKPAPKIKLSLTGHLFRLSQAKDAWYYASGKKMRQDRTGASGKDLGRELDLIATWQANSNIKLMAGYCWFWHDEFIENTGPAGSTQWAFLQAMLAF